MPLVPWTAARLGASDIEAASAPAGMLPVAPVLAEFSRGGLRRGTAVSVSGAVSVATSLTRR